MLQPRSLVLIISQLLLCTTLVSAQELSGWVVDEKDTTTIPGVHVVNKSTLKGTLTNADGHFTIQLQWGDTIVFSNISYKYFYFIYNDSATALEDVVIEMEEQNYLLNEVSIFSYRLTSNEDEEMIIKKPLYPTSEELEDGRIIEATAANPAEFLYNLFGSKPRQLRILAELKAAEAYREKLQESNNRESVVSLTGLSQEELQAFMFYCKYSNVQMKAMSDYAFLQSVQRCYHQYVKDKELEDFLQQFD